MDQNKNKKTIEFVTIHQRSNFGAGSEDISHESFYLNEQKDLGERIYTICPQGKVNVLRNGRKFEMLTMDDKVYSDLVNRSYEKHLSEPLFLFCIPRVYDNEGNDMFYDDITEREMIFNLYKVDDKRNNHAVKYYSSLRRILILYKDSINKEQIIVTKEKHSLIYPQKELIHHFEDDREMNMIQVEEDVKKSESCEIRKKFRVTDDDSFRFSTVPLY